MCAPKTALFGPFRPLLSDCVWKNGRTTNSHHGYQGNDYGLLLFFAWFPPFYMNPFWARLHMLPLRLWLKKKFGCVILKLKQSDTKAKGGKYCFLSTSIGWFGSCAYVVTAYCSSRSRKRDSTTENIWKRYIWTADKDVNMKAIFAVMNTTWAVVKISHWFSSRILRGNSPTITLHVRCFYFSFA